MGLWLGCSGVDLDRRIPVDPGGKLSVALTLGWGFAFDKGSLTISSHERDEVRVVVDTTGWGEYAVDVDIEEVDGGVDVDGRVAGLLHWLFGGPTVDLHVWVPPNYSVDARIEDGPLLIEDVTGPIDARIQGSELTLRSAEGRVRLVAAGGPIQVEDVDGSLELDARDGRVDVSGVRGDLRIRSRSGRVEVSSVRAPWTSPPPADGSRSSGLEGSARVMSDNGRIEVQELEGDLEVKTNRGRIEVDDLDGRILARSARGGIEVRFVGQPSGTIETERGSIDVEVPYDARFDLLASTSRGRVELDSDLEFEHHPEQPDGAQLGHSLQYLGQQFAARVTAQVHENLQRGFETGDWNFDWDFQLDLDEHDRDALDDGDDAPKEKRDDGSRRRERHGWNGFDGWDGWQDWQREGESREEARERRWRNHPLRHAFGSGAVEIAGSVNGGGDKLELRTERGSIQIDDR